LRPPASELRKDRLAAVVIRTGGVTVILLVVAMVVSIAAQAVPLFRPATVGPTTDVGGEPALAVGAGPRDITGWWLTANGHLRARVAGTIEGVAAVGDGATLTTADTGPGGVVATLTADGRGIVGRVLTGAAGRDHRGRTVPEWRPIATVENDPPLAVRGITAGCAGERCLTVRWTDHGLDLRWWGGARNRDPATAAIDDVIQVAIADGLDIIAAVSGSGGLHLFGTADLRPVPVEQPIEPASAIRFLVGGRSLVVAGRDGAVNVVTETPRVAVTNNRRDQLEADGRVVASGETVIVPAVEATVDLVGREGVDVRRVEPLWRVIRRLEPTRRPVTGIAPAHRGRSFAVADAGGEVSVYNATSGRLLTRRVWVAEEISAIGFAPRSDALIAATSTGVIRRAITCPHPEISLRTLFLPVWYEGAAEPRTVWQTSGGADDFQPKFGLWPLLVGTLKATVYAMFISVPLALMAALYVSQLAPGWLQSVVKPTVEMMAAVPTVVVGFLAALWLAPRLQLWLFPAIAAGLSLPVGVVVALWAWRLLPGATRRRLPAGSEWILLVASCLLVVGVAVAAAGPVEGWLFDGDFQRTLFTEWGIRYEQRNAVIVGLALGFAVIPVIFTIAEDACSSVPSSLVQAARALGATRWQAAVRLVVPAASPGLFAAVMLGLGRAVGETMIVLMAAGNTPILDLGPFTGMRTMSAAIAFEIPEATVGGTLFRVLFLAGFLLFVMSLLSTTAADLVGRRLRRRHAQL
jgi:ABC-type uncharacterized transport system permease subunit